MTNVLAIPKPDLEKDVVVEVERIGDEVLLRVGFLVLGMTPAQALELAEMLARKAGPVVLEGEMVGK